MTRSVARRDAATADAAATEAVATTVRQGGGDAGGEAGPARVVVGWDAVTRMKLVVEAGGPCECSMATGDVCGSCAAWVLLLLGGGRGDAGAGVEGEQAGQGLGGKGRPGKGAGRGAAVVDEFPTWWRCPVRGGGA
jgi:hypothetical protein